MRFRALDASSPEELAAWLGRWSAWPEREVMAHPSYAALFARPGDRVVCATGEDAGGSILMPLLLRPLAAEPWAAPGEDRWDATSPYGYGGPFAWGQGPRDDAAFWEGYGAYCRAARVVTTFARLPLFPGQLPALPSPPEEVGPNVVIPLGGGRAALWRGYDTKVRRWVRTAQEAGIEVELDPEGRRLEEFLAVYEHTMARHGAEDFYRFPRAFFERLVVGLAGHFAFFHGLQRGRCISSDLVLLSARRGYYFLGGTLEEAFPLGPNYLVKHRAAEWAIDQGLAELVLGGGHPRSEGLLRYKRAFARRGEVPFRVGAWVHDEAAYRELVAARAAGEVRAGGTWAPRPGFFPAYRG